MKLRTLKPRLGTLANRVATMQPGSWRTDKQTSTQRGYGYKWQKARAEYLGTHPFCVYCLRNAGVVATDMGKIILACARKGIAMPYATVVDHRIPHRGDEKLFWSRSNWQSLCATHHSRDKQREESR